jgi:hypothetical protein
MILLPLPSLRSYNAAGIDLRLPRSLHERLKKAGGERGMGEEVRRRLEVSFATERSSTDAKMRELLDAVASCADEISRDFGPWSEEPYAFAVLKATVNIVMKHFEPKGKAAPNLNPDSVLAFLFDDDPSAKPENVSSYYVSFWTRRRAERVEKEKRR